MTKSSLKNIIRQCLKEVKNEFNTEPMSSWITQISSGKSPDGKTFAKELKYSLSKANIAPVFYKKTIEKANQLIDLIDQNNPHTNIWVK